MTRLRILLTYGAAVCLLASGLLLFSAAEQASATGLGGDCTIVFVTVPTSAGPHNTSGYTLTCSGLESGWESTYAVFQVGAYVVYWGGDSIGQPFYPGSCTSACGGGPTSFVASYPGGSTSFISTGGVSASPFNVMTTSDYNSYYSEEPPGTIQYYQPGWDYGNGSATYGPPQCDLNSIAGYVSGVKANGYASYSFTLYFTGYFDQIVILDTEQPATTARPIDGHTFYQEQVMDQISTEASPLAFSVSPEAGDDINPQIWCDSGGTWVDWGPASGITTYSGPVATPCSFQSASGYTGETSDGTTLYEFGFSYLGGADALVALDTTQASSGSTTTIHGKSFYNGQILARDDSPLSPDFLSVTPKSGVVVNPDVWCDSGGTWVDWGESSAMAGTSNPPAGVGTPTYDQCGDGGAFCFQTCFSNTGLSLYNPISWVTATVKFTVCGLRWLVEPSSSKWQALTQQFGVSTNSPTIGASSASQWLGNITYMLTVGPHDGAVAIQSCVTSGCTASLLTIGMSVSVGSHTYTADAPSALAAVASSDGSWSAILVDTLAAALLVMFFIEIARFLRRVLGSGE